MRIAIVGTGISGLTLALRLQQLGVDTTLYSDATPDDLRGSRLPNTVARFPHTLERERELGIDHWGRNDYGMEGLRLTAGPPLDVTVNGRLERGPRAVDFRVLLPQWLEDYAERGGRVEIVRQLDAGLVSSAAAGHDLAVVAVGRGSIGDLFPIDATRSPFPGPQRRLFAGLVDGLDLPYPRVLSFNLAPGVGEIFQMPMLTASGVGTNILIEAIPGGPLEPITTLPVTDNAFTSQLVEVLHAYAPDIASRVGADFRVRSERDALQGAVRPAVRRAWAGLSDGAAVAIGDAWVANDPITGQGANIGSHCAWVAAAAIAEGGPFDEEFGRRLEERMWSYAGPVTALTNAFLQPAPPHVVGLLVAASQDQGVANALAAGFGKPVEFAMALGDPVATDAFITDARDLAVASTV